MHARIQIYWCRSSISRHLKLELLTQFPASNDEKYINVVYIWRKFVSFYGYVHWRMTTEISVMYGSEKVNLMGDFPLCSRLERTKLLHSTWYDAHKYMTPHHPSSSKYKHTLPCKGKNAVTAYLISKQLLPFDFVQRQCWHVKTALPQNCRRCFLPRPEKSTHLLMRCPMEWRHFLRNSSNTCVFSLM